MTTYYKDNYHNLPSPRHTGPNGNLSMLSFRFATNSSGIMADSNKATAVAATDVIVLGVLEAGTRIVDAIATVSDAFTASTTFDLGYLYVDGVDVTAAPQDADALFDALALDAAATTHKTKGIAPVTLAKDAYLVLTNNTDAQAAAGILDIDLIVKMTGGQ